MGQTSQLESRSESRALRKDPEELRRTILNAFSHRAREAGIRGVVMIELARDLGMSSRTLYRVFPSKADLVHAMVMDWMRRFEAVQSERIAEGEGAVGRVLVALGGWLDFTARFHPSFWSELARDYPEAHALYQSKVRGYLRAGRDLLEPQLRPGLQPDLVFGQLMRSIEHASNPARCEKLGITRLQAVVQVVGVWARGALRRDPPAED